MGCNSRTSCWDFSATEQESLLNYAPIICFGNQITAEHYAGDLKLGSLVDSSNFLETHSLASLMDSSSSSGSHKRVRANRDTVQVPTCLVDGCVADLGKCREYHRRHRVCEAHSKTSVVTIGCREQRFCQQCSRFHSLSEFDESKRSCRKRLDGHNRRRRKPQPHSLASNSSNYIPLHQGPTVISYGTQYVPSSAVATSSWNEAVKAQNNHLYTLNSNCKTNNFPSSFSQGYIRERQFPFLQSDSHLPQPHLNNPNTTIGNSGSSRNHTLRLSDGFDRVTTISDRASSLLSSSYAAPCGFNIPTHFVQRPMQPSIIPSSYNSLASASEGYSSSMAADCDSNIKLDSLLK